MKRSVSNVWVVLAALGLVLALTSEVSAQTTGGPYQYYTVAPCRLVDTRFNLGASVLTAGISQNIAVKSHCSVPATAKAAAITLTVVGPQGSGFLIAWAAGSTQPGTSNINVNANEPAIANGAIVALATTTPDLSVIYGAGAGYQTQLIVDVVGYYQ